MKKEQKEALKKTAAMLEWTIKAASDNEKKYLDSTKGNIKKAVEDAKKMHEEIKKLLGETPEPPKPTDDTLSGKISEFHNKIGELISALDPAMQTTADRCKEIKEAVTKLKELPSRTSDQEAQLVALETEDTEIKGQLYPALDALLDKCKEIQKLLEEITGDPAKFNALEKALKDVVEKDIPIFLTIETQISKVYLTAEGKL